MHKHVCGYANCTDYTLLLERNDLCNEAAAAYVAQSIENCTACRTTVAPQPSKKVSISSLNKHFNEIVCIDHFYLDEMRLMHCMALASRYSLAVGYASTKDAFHAFEGTRASQFWYPDAVQIDKAFQVSCFKTHMDRLGIAIRPVPPGTHDLYGNDTMSAFEIAKRVHKTSSIRKIVSRYQKTSQVLIISFKQRASCL